MATEEVLITGLPDPDAARRFLGQLEERVPSQKTKLLKNSALLSDVLTLVSFSPLLATTLLQNPDYFPWLDRKRRESGVRSKDEILESLAQFSLTNSQLESQVLFARFRRRELLRIYLRDIRRLATIAEITEEISNLADAVLESALRLARREMDSRFGQPQESDDKGRSTTARFCIAALGKLGSRELNYSSDIDLLFIYSEEGNTTGSGTRGIVTNREYFIKLAEFTAKLVGQPSGEGAAYRVDLRLRPHGSLGPLAVSVNDMVRYYKGEARPWERQVMIRSRGCAGDIELFRQFFSKIEDLVFSKDETPASALANVRRSKEKIDQEQGGRSGFDVKLGSGGIREIEFLAQALQLAYGGRDAWLRSPHTLISLDRLTDRKHLGDVELTELSAAYEFLRRTEHVLQMENGVQTHTVPDDKEKRSLVSRRVTFAGGGNFEKLLSKHAKNVRRVFERIFADNALTPLPAQIKSDVSPAQRQLSNTNRVSVTFAIFDLESDIKAIFDRVTEVSPYFAGQLAASPQLASHLPDPQVPIEPDYSEALMAATEVSTAAGIFRERLSALRRVWAKRMIDIAVHDIFETITAAEAKRLQTALAEASIAAALEIVRHELISKYKAEVNKFPFAVLALGKLGGRGIDYESDLDVILVYDDAAAVLDGVSHAEFFSRAAELFVTTLSSMTRDGHLYRVDLRLRPYGSKGLSAMPGSAFLEYMRDTAAVWELLAFVKLRAVGGDQVLGEGVEQETRRIIHDRASAIDPEELRSETLRVRLALEKERSRNRRGSEIDIKYGEGGMLDVYFAMRYLQLLWNVPDDANDRSTLATLDRLTAHRGSGGEHNSSLLTLRQGYEFLSALDHNIRLTIGRTTRVPTGNEAAMNTIASRLGLTSSPALLEQLTLNLLAIREAFDGILGSGDKDS